MEKSKKLARRMVTAISLIRVILRGIVKRCQKVPIIAPATHSEIYCKKPTLLRLCEAESTFTSKRRPKAFLIDFSGRPSAMM